MAGLLALVSLHVVHILVTCVVIFCYDNVIHILKKRFISSGLVQYKECL